MSLSKDQIEQKFNRTNVKKRDLPVTPRSLQEYLQYMDYKIRKEFKSFTLMSLCGGAERGGFIVEKNFERAFATMSLNQKADYYEMFVDSVARATSKIEKNQANPNGKIEPQKTREPVRMKLKVGKQSKAFEQLDIIMDNCIVRSESKKLPDIDLRNFLLRKSKKKNPYCYALQAIRPADIDTIRFAFLSAEDEKKYLPVIEQQISEACCSNIERQISDFLNKRKSFPNQPPSKQVKLKNDAKQVRPPSEGFLNLQNNSLHKSRKDLNKSVIEDIVKSRDQQELDQQLTQFINQQNQQVQKLQLQKKKSQSTPYFKQYRNIFKIMLPTYSLKQVSRFNHYGSIYQSKHSQFYIYLNAKDHSEFKMQFIIDLPQETVCKAIYNVQLYKYWHPEIDEGQVKLKISSQNSCIVYLKTKAFSEWYRERDYLLLTHMFRMQDAYYIIEKSIENANYIPFQSITRGKFMYIVWKIEPEHTSKQTKSKALCRVTMQLKVNHEGLLNKNHQKQLTLRHLKGFQNMEDYYQKAENEKKLSDLMGFHWVISDRESLGRQSQNENGNFNANSLKTCDFQDASEISENQDDDVFYSIEDLSQEEKQQQNQQQQQKSEHQIEPQKLQNTSMMHSQLLTGKVQEQNIITDPQGFIILPKKYYKKKQILQPFNTEIILMEFPYDNILEKNDWVTEKGGGLKLVNQEKINSQNNVLKFIMKTLKKNLFSGKGILNISLPVQIFSTDSNLQRLCSSMSLGPHFLEPVVKTPDPLQRFKQTLAFGLSNSIIYFDVQKTFNPILGQTYQGFIRGCPIYAQQISHHPPITSVYFVGRGYKVMCSLEAVVHLHMNSGDGINEGMYHVVFDDGGEIVFQTPPAEISGLAMGDRRFNFKDRGIYFDVKNLYFCQMKLEATGGLFSKKKRDFSDQIDGQILKVKPEFLRKFMQAKPDKKPSPSTSQIVQKLGQLSGRWSYQLKIDGKQYYNIRKNVPDRMIDQIYPLNSNSNYREDLYYRKKNDLSRSQIQKERLEVLQRGDRKLREKFHGPAKH